MNVRREEIWLRTPLVTALYELIKRKTKGGELTITESDLLSELIKEVGYHPGKAEIANALLTLEVFGYIRVKSSGKHERIIIFREKRS